MRYLLFSVVAIGITLANVVYVAGGFAVGWWLGRKRTKEDARAPVLMGVGVLALVAGLVEVQDLVYPLTKERFTFPYSHTELFGVDWQTAPERFSTVVRTLGLDDHVALDRHRQHGEQGVVGVLADQVDPAGSADSDGRACGHVSPSGRSDWHVCAWTGSSGAKRSP